MWTTDQPFINRIRQLVTDVADVASERNADLLLTGVGGDDVVMDLLLAGDLFRSGRIGRWREFTRSQAAWHDSHPRAFAVTSMLDATPAWARSMMRRGSEPAESPNPLARTEALAHLDRVPQRRVGRFPSMTQATIAEFVANPRRVRMNEHEGAMVASRGVGVSHPFCDRDVIEWVVAAPPTSWPHDGRPKALARTAFAGRLPASVLERTTKTTARTWLDHVTSVQAPEFAGRYPHVPEAAEAYIDSNAYQAALGTLDHASAPEREHLWRVWELFVWLDTLERYRSDFRSSG